MVKIRQNRARRPDRMRPARPAHAVRLCSTAPGKRGRGSGMLCRREKRRPESETRAAGRGKALCPAVGRSARRRACACAVASGLHLFAPVCVSYPALSCMGISPERLHRGGPAPPCIQPSAWVLLYAGHGTMPGKRGRGTARFAARRNDGLKVRRGRPEGKGPLPGSRPLCPPRAARFAAHGAPCGEGLFLLY